MEKKGLSFSAYPCESACKRGYHEWKYSRGRKRITPQQADPLLPLSDRGAKVRQSLRNDADVMRIHGNKGLILEQDVLVSGAQHHDFAQAVVMPVAFPERALGFVQNVVVKNRQRHVSERFHNFKSVPAFFGRIEDFLRFVRHVILPLLHKTGRLRRTARCCTRREAADARGSPSAPEAYR